MPSVERSDQSLALEYWAPHGQPGAQRDERNARLEACRRAVAEGRQTAADRNLVRGQFVQEAAESWAKTCLLAKVPLASFKKRNGPAGAQDMGGENIELLCQFFQVDKQWLETGAFFRRTAADQNPERIYPSFLCAEVERHSHLHQALIYLEMWHMLNGSSGHWGRWHTADLAYQDFFDDFSRRYGVHLRQPPSNADLGFDRRLEDWVAVKHPCARRARVVHVTRAEYARIRDHLRGRTVCSDVYLQEAKSAGVVFYEAFMSARAVVEREMAGSPTNQAILEAMLDRPSLPEVPTGLELRIDDG